MQDYEEALAKEVRPAPFSSSPQLAEGPYFQPFSSQKALLVDGNGCKYIAHG